MAAGYHTLYPPQEEAIIKGVLAGKNIVLACPTASGKTLVAEMAAIKHVFDRGGKVLYLTPLRALASEKFDEFRKYSKLRLSDEGAIRIAISTGDFDKSDAYLSKYDIIIATNEKVDSLIRHRVNWIHEVKLVVADEVHLLQEGDRGPTLEVALTRLRRLNPNVQILALSATISNAAEIAEWLDASLVALDWRPVPLKEGVFLNNELAFADGTSTRVQRVHSNDSINIAANAVENGGQALIFAESRKTAVSLAQKSLAVIRHYLSMSEIRALKLISAELLSSSERTRIGESLSEMMARGVAFHHAGLPHIYRKIVETSFRKGLIKLIVATPTLASGVNLPARTVIINSYVRYEPGIGRIEIPVFEYKQMAGRAGRPKYDSSGEAVLIARNEDEQQWLLESYVRAGAERIWSKLAADGVLRVHTLATIASGFAKTEDGLFDFFGKTFYAHQYGHEVIKTPVRRVLDYLVRNEMVIQQGDSISATEFGRRVSELYIDPESATIIREGLFNRPIVLSENSFLHLISRTPDMSPRFYPSRHEIEDLKLFLYDHKDELMFEVPEYYANSVEYEVLLGELKTVRILVAWINESKENDMLERFKVEPGDLYRLIDSADWLLNASYELAKLFKHRDLIKKLLELKIRSRGGVKAELMSIIELQNVGRIRARALYNSGYHTLEHLRHASVTELLRVPGIGAQLAKKIKDQVGGLIKKNELVVVDMEKAEQRTLGDF